MAGPRRGRLTSALHFPHRPLIRFKRWPIVAIRLRINSLRYLFEGRELMPGADVLSVAPQTFDLRDYLNRQSSVGRRYDQDLGALLSVQDEVTSSIVTVLPERIWQAAKRPTRWTHTIICKASTVITWRPRRPTARQNLTSIARLNSTRTSHVCAWKACTLDQAMPGQVRRVENAKVDG